MDKLEPINMICPNCGNGNYMRRITGKNVGKLNVKCINCNKYYNYDSLKENGAKGVRVESSDLCKGCRYFAIRENNEYGNKGDLIIRCVNEPLCNYIQTRMFEKFRGEIETIKKELKLND